MAYVNGYIYVGSPWQRARTEGVVIAERNSRVQPRYAPLPPAGPPYNVSAATSPQEQCIDLAWLNGTGAPAETEVWESPDDATWSLLVIAQGLGGNPDGDLPLTTTSFRRNVGLFHVLRYYQFRHVNAADWSAFSATVSAYSQNDLPDGPPSNLTATVRARPAGETQLDVAWVAGDTTAQTQVYQNGALVATVAAGVTALGVTGLTASTAYTYQVRHLISGVTSAFSNSAAATTLVDGPDADPYNPSATGGTGVAGQGLIFLAWANGDATAQTELHVSTDGGSTYALLTTAAAGATTYTHNPGYNLLRYYKYRHTKNGVLSNFTAAVSATSGQDIPDAAPSALSVTVPAAPTGAHALSLAWTNGDASCLTEIRRGGVAVTDVAAGVTSYTDTGLSDDTTYGYTVAHLKNGVYSPATPQVTGRTIDAPEGAPSATTATQQTGVAGQRLILAGWTNGDPGSSTKLYVSSDGSTFGLLTTLAPGVASYLHDTGAFDVERWYYPVHTENGCDSAAGPVAAAFSGLDVPDAPPSGVTVTPLARPAGETQLAVAWTNGDASCQSNVYRNGGYLTTVSAGATALTDTGLVANTNYTYEIRHIKSGVESTGASATGATLVDGPDAAPFNLGVTAPVMGYQRAVVTWQNGDATCSTELWQNGGLLVTVAPGVTQYADPSGVTLGTTYTYQARHLKNGVYSSFSNSAAETPSLGLEQCTNVFLWHRDTAPPGFTSNAWTVCFFTPARLAKNTYMDIQESTDGGSTWTTTLTGMVNLYGQSGIVVQPGGIPSASFATRFVLYTLDGSGNPVNPIYSNVVLAATGRPSTAAPTWQDDGGGAFARIADASHVFLAMDSSWDLAAGRTIKIWKDVDDSGWVLHEEIASGNYHPYESSLPELATYQHTIRFALTFGGTSPYTDPPLTSNMAIIRKTTTDY